MQQIKGKLKNSPWDAPQVPCSESRSLNRVERLSESGIVRPLINSEVDLRSGMTEHNSRVYVLNMQGQPLMPTAPGKARKLLLQGKAKVVKRKPFTIQLNYASGETKQPITLGIDTGYSNIGFSAITETKELISGTLTMDDKTSSRLRERSMYRRGRRSKLWYRKPRFANRRKPEGWLPPSTQRRYDTHLNLIKRIKMILPISKTVIEVANFDIQKIMNPEIKGNGYQQGNLYGYHNMKSYLISRERGKCQLCGKDFKGQSVHIHHCRQRNEMGSDRPENLAVLHKTCHDNLHKKGLRLSKPKSYKPNVFMSIIHKKFYQDIPDMRVTYGYITFTDRKELGLEKSHATDAFVIAGGTIHERVKTMELHHVHRNNRVLQLNRKGYRPSIKRDKSKANPYDLFWVKGKQYVCKGMFSMGRYICYGSTKKKEYFKFTDVEKIYRQGSIVWN